MIIEIKSCRTCPCMRIINNLSECRVAIDEMDWEYLEKEQIPKKIHRDCPLRKHEVKQKKEGDK